MGWIKSLFGSGNRDNDSPPEVAAIFEKLHRFLSDEALQNERLPEPLATSVKSGLACDALPDGTGEFGRTPTNPIPVNGPLGQVLYLTNLLTDADQHIMFHRLGSLGRIDAYETVSFDARVWDILFLSLYHPRKSRRTPSGYRVAAGRNCEFIPLGTNQRVSPFPQALYPVVGRFIKVMIGAPMSPPKLRLAIERGEFTAPSNHRAKLHDLHVAGLVSAETDQGVAPG